MTNSHSLSRRSLLRLATMAGAASLGQRNALAQAPDYRALVCIFFSGGNDGHNMVIPQTASQYNQY